MARHGQDRATAVEPEHAALGAPPPQIQRLKAIQAEFQALRSPGSQSADKAFFDDLSGDIALG
ncbi:MAG TPA: hypothetical protein DDZ81_26720 [Acetobacteraceae bacterium]|jgi:hypothetical protein|nr:hypothetical protein [Acetobacteraceae bacterium]